MRARPQQRAKLQFRIRETTEFRLQSPYTVQSACEKPLYHEGTIPGTSVSLPLSISRVIRAFGWGLRLVASLDIAFVIGGQNVILFDIAEASCTYHCGVYAGQEKRVVKRVIDREIVQQEAVRVGSTPRKIEWGNETILPYEGGSDSEYVNQSQFVLESFKAGASSAFCVPD